MNLSIELDGNTAGYGHIHKTGCRDLRDPEYLGNAISKTHAEGLAENLTGWGYEPGEYHFAPCVKL